MDINEEFKFKNIITLTLKDVQTNEIIQTVSQPNTLTNNGKSLILDILGGSNGIINIGAVGTGLGATSAESVLLKTEIGRNNITYTRAGTTGTFSVFFNTNQANGTISEVAFFGGTSSYTSTNTGVMMDRVLLAATVAKTISTVLNVDLDVTLA